jgi:hypothetical protein
LRIKLGEGRSRSLQRAFRERPSLFVLSLRGAGYGFCFGVRRGLFVCYGAAPVLGCGCVHFETSIDVDPPAVLISGRRLFVSVAENVPERERIDGAGAGDKNRIRD